MKPFKKESNEIYYIFVYECSTIFFEFIFATSKKLISEMYYISIYVDLFFDYFFVYVCIYIYIYIIHISFLFILY